MKNDTRIKEMKKCPKCGVENEEQYNRCKSCFTSLDGCFVSEGVRQAEEMAKELLKKRSAASETNDGQTVDSSPVPSAERAGEMNFITPSIAAFWCWFTYAVLVIGTLIVYVNIAKAHSGYHSSPWSVWEIFLPIIFCINGLVIARVLYEGCILFFKHYEVARSVNRKLELILKQLQRSDAKIEA